MPRFRRKRAEVEAVQWFAAGQVPPWAQKVVIERPDMFIAETYSGDGLDHFPPGSWIVRDASGSVWGHMNGKFTEIYEPTE